MATVFQKCKTEPTNKYYPCEKTRCGHNWTVRYREPGGRTARQREKTFAKKTGPDGADAFASKVEHDKGMVSTSTPSEGTLPFERGRRSGSGFRYSPKARAGTTRGSPGTTWFRTWVGRRSPDS